MRTADNHGTALDPDWLRRIDLDDDSVAARARRYVAGVRESDATVARVTESEELMQAVACLDLTSLGADDSDTRVEALCAEARAPLASASPEGPSRATTVAAVCVLPASVAAAVAALGDSPVPVAAACGFPAGEGTVEQKIDETRLAAESGAREIDVVIDRRLILGEEWRDLYDEVRKLRDASAGLTLKVILRTGTLPTSSHVARAGLTCAAAGADFLKTSTGMEPVNATLEAGIAMAAAIRAYHERTGYRVGLKPAGGLRTASDALEWTALTRGELDANWIDPGLFRLGASSLLGALRARLSDLANR